MRRNLPAEVNTPARDDGTPLWRRAATAVWPALRLYLGLITLVATSAWLSPRDLHGGILFLDRGNLLDILRQVASNGILAVGMTLVILTGGIDLSVGSVLGLGCVVGAILLNERAWTAAAMLATGSAALVCGGAAGWLAGHLVPWRSALRPLAIAAGGIAVGGAAALACARAATSGMSGAGVLGCVAAVGIVAGGLNGVLVAWGGLQPFVATLATMTALWGVARLVSGEGGAVHVVEFGPGRGDPWYDRLGERLPLDLPVPGLFFLAAALLAWLVLRFTALGRAVYATGGNEQATRLSGVSVARVKLFAYAASGLLAALAGALYVAEYHQGKPDAGRGVELHAIAAVVIGGASLAGGRGTIAGTVAGVFIMGILTNILQIRQVDSNWQLVLTGSVIALAVLLQEGKLIPGRRKLKREPRR